METNNFKRLLEEDEQSFNEGPNDRVYDKVTGTLGLFQLFGNIVDIFLPRMVDVFVMATGGRHPKDDEPPRPTPPSESSEGSDPRGAAPGDPFDRNK